MTQVFDEQGKAVPVTIIEAEPNVVTQVKLNEKDGYQAVQLGFGRKKRLTKPLRGHLRGLTNFRWLREFRIKETVEKNDKISYKKGQAISVSVFMPGDIIKVTGISKGRGFQGVVKRHGFKGSPASHGHKDQLRMPGSIGATEPSRVFKGKRMAGRMGNQKITVKNLKVIRVDKENNLIYIKGAVPGSYNSLVMISGLGVSEDI